MKFNFTPPFSERQQKTIAWTPKFFAFPSIIGAFFIAQHVLRSKKRRGGVYHRILLSMSFHDLIYGIKAFISTWPMPKNTPFVHGAKGTTETCVVAGLFGHGGSLTSIFYNGSLTLYFLLVVRYGWKERHIKKHIEFWLHAVPMAVGWSTALAGVPLDLYNAFGWTCWINTYPLGCIDGVTCERGDNAGLYRWAFFHIELWTVFGLCFVAMGVLYHKLLQQEKVMQRYVFGQGEANNKSNNNTIITNRGDDGSGLSSCRNPQNESLSRENSTKFAMQATFYGVIFFFTWCFPMLQTILSQRSGTLYFPLIMLSAMLSSLQGFSNALIYLRPRWIRFREKYPEVTSWSLILSIVLSSRDMAKLDQRVLQEVHVSNVVVVESRQSKASTYGGDALLGESGEIVFNNGEETTTPVGEIEMALIVDTPDDKRVEGANNDDETEDLYME